MMGQEAAAAAQSHPWVVHCHLQVTRRQQTDIVYRHLMDNGPAHKQQQQQQQQQW
jgi:hypothetical protein